MGAILAVSAILAAISAHFLRLSANMAAE